MGRARRPLPKRLGAKLLAIRSDLRLTQKEMVKRLDYHEAPVYPGHISEYERGLREPPLGLLLRYARLIQGITVEMLIDDKMELTVSSLRMITRIIEDKDAALALKQLLNKKPK